MFNSFNRSQQVFDAIGASDTLLLGVYLDALGKAVAHESDKNERLGFSPARLHAHMVELCRGKRITEIRSAVCRTHRDIVKCCCAPDATKEERDAVWEALIKRVVTGNVLRRATLRFCETMGVHPDVASTTSMRDYIVNVTYTPDELCEHCCHHDSSSTELELEEEAELNTLPLPRVPPAMRRAPSCKRRLFSASPTISEVNDEMTELKMATPPPAYRPPTPEVVEDATLMYVPAEECPFRPVHEREETPYAPYSPEPRERVVHSPIHSPVAYSPARTPPGTPPGTPRSSASPSPPLKRRRGWDPALAATADFAEDDRPAKRRLLAHIMKEQIERLAEMARHIEE